MAATQGATPLATSTSRLGTKSTDIGPLKREDSPAYLTRVKQEIEDFFGDAPTGIFIAPDEDDFTTIHALVMGPSGTPYEDGFFEFQIRCPSEYPLKPPILKFLTTDSGRVTFHPNLYSCGYVSLNILGDGWSQAQGIESLLVVIKSLLNQDPLYNEPEFVKAQADKYASNYEAFVEHETIRVAVCDTVAACLSGKSTLPPTLREVVLKKFVECYDRYEAAVKSKLHLSGNEMPKMYYYHKGTFEYAGLLTRLQDLKQKVADREREHSPTYLKKLKKKNSDFFAHEPTGIYIAPDGNDIAEIQRRTKTASSSSKYDARQSIH
ncbi:ubiquitin-conjugating enzyme E2 Z [Rhipicephalus sanguineus]|uniref:Ubiquitin-conjugating enzyme E2 Z n=1 Tax=Rhipicephalus sanguineus TaxID=34632 RepID=A0A9D4PD14_RHISA|nr:ubiquitin-conjugating enzyme E2 Z [Rhipicephalus sanguineus]KAH7935767.1 hypothetical protein HPB52_013222 [Rhipicephalus sanguineus]